MKPLEGGRLSRIIRRATDLSPGRGCGRRRAAARVICPLIVATGLAVLGVASFGAGAGAGAGAGHGADAVATAAAVATAYGPGAPIDFALFPPDNPWNTDISSYPVDPHSDRYITSIGLDIGLHPDFGTVWNAAPIGIPYMVVSGNQPKVPISFYYPEESGPGPYPIPSDVPIEGGPTSGGDRHILVLDADHMLLYEVYDAHPAGDGWEAGSGAVFDLTSNALRPDGWTSADAAGLPILPGLVRYDEVQRGEITHALRFTVSRTQRAYRSPATHFASDDTDPDLPPMGLRVRLKANVDISGFPAQVQVVLRALKKYGMFVADNGADWYITGAPDPRWDDDALHTIEGITGRDFEVVGTPPPTSTSTTAGPMTTTTTIAPCATTTTLSADPVFSDIGSSPYEEAILGLARAGIVGGYPGLSGPEFRPDTAVKRAQFAKMVCGALFIPVIEGLVAPFDDLGLDDADDLYPHEYVAAAAAEGITRGTGPRRFDPYESITRTQVVTMMVRGAEARNPSALLLVPAGYLGSFPGFSEVHGPAMRVAEFSGLLEGLRGFGPGWDPWAAATRGEVAQILWNLMKR